MPTVAAGGGHILNIDFFCCKFVKEATGQRAARAKTNTLLTMKKKKKKKENKEKKLFLNKEKLHLLLKFGRYAGRTGGAKCNSLRWQGEWQGECG